ncbi:hypothetical protein C8R46DRAFT_1088633 [Mycena filopes]|nr:hypothetical protein C8R46DRAFT_1088633 [Mycena filopes]
MDRLRRAISRSGGWMAQRVDDRKSVDASLVKLNKLLRKLQGRNGDGRYSQVITHYTLERDILLGELEVLDEMIANEAPRSPDEAREEDSHITRLKGCLVRVKQILDAAKEDSERRKNDPYAPLALHRSVPVSQGINLNNMSMDGIVRRSSREQQPQTRPDYAENWGRGSEEQNAMTQIQALRDNPMHRFVAADVNRLVDQTSPGVVLAAMTLFINPQRPAQLTLRDLVWHAMAGGPVEAIYMMTIKPREAFAALQNAQRSQTPPTQAQVFQSLM